MEIFLTTLFKQVSELNPLDILGFILSLAYVIFISKKYIIAWLFAALSSSIYVFLCFQSKLYLDSFLQLFYVYMAIWGWMNWKNSDKNQISVKFGTLKMNASLILLSFVISLIVGYIFYVYTDQAYPYLDAHIMTFSMLATYLVGKRFVENWIYFIVIDALAVPVYWNRELYLMSILFVIYVFLAIYGFISWRKNIENA